MTCGNCGTAVSEGGLCSACSESAEFYSLPAPDPEPSSPSPAASAPPYLFADPTPSAPASPSSPPAPSASSSAPPRVPAPTSTGPRPAPVERAIDRAGQFRSSRFEIQRTLGSGAVGIVYLARERSTGKPFALKVLKTALHQNAEVIARFRREVDIARKFSHPNIGQLYELIEEQGHIYIVMQYIEGLDLGEWVKRLNPSLDQKLAVVKAVASAVDAAHAAGVVHRDLKPGNVRVTRDGTPFVLDFGVAAVDEGGDITRIGSFIGTPMYMSPEQAQGKRVDFRSDIYSLGAVFYELVAGRPPFIGDSGITIALKHVRESPFKPRSLNPSIPPVVERVILKCLEKDPKSRPARASDIVREIEEPLQKELAEMRSAARAVAQESHSGDLRELSLFQYLRVLAPIRRNFLLEIVNNDEFGRYHFRGGHLVHAEAGNLRDQEVAYNLFYWTRGIYRVVADAEAPEKETVSIPWPPFVEAYFARVKQLMMAAHAQVPGPVLLDLLDPRGTSVYRYCSDDDWARGLGERASVSLETFSRARTHVKSSNNLRVSKGGGDAGILFCFVPGLRHYFYAATDPRADLDALYRWIKGELEQGMIEALHDCLRRSDRKVGGKGVAIKVLLVEKEEFLGNLTRIKLRSLGMDVYLVRDGSKAMETAPQFQPDVVVLATQVPGYSGYDVCRMMAAEPALARIPIVLLGPGGSRESIEEMRLPGVVELLEKPILLGQLVELVEKHGKRGATLSRSVAAPRPRVAEAARQ